MAPGFDAPEPSRYCRSRKGTSALQRQQAYTRVRFAERCNGFRLVGLPAYAAIRNAPGLQRIDKYLARAFWYTVRKVLPTMRDFIPRSLAGSAPGQRFGHRECRGGFSLDQCF